jgi:nucleoside-diphosphate-sugar epimerase
MERVRALVTGGAGFIGSNLVHALVERGDDVRVLDNFSTGSRGNLEGLDVDVVEGELRSYERVHAATRGVEVVYHLGALGSVPRSVQDPLTSNAVNVEGTLNVLLAARDEGVRRVVFSSSTSVYGTSPELPTTESTPTDPISPYGVTKLAAERYCISFSRVYHSFEAVVLRYFNVFGPRQSPHSQYAAAVPLFIATIDAGEPITIYGDGRQRRDFTYVGDAAEATLAAAEHGRAGELYNVASGDPRPLAAVVELIGELLGADIDVRHEWPQAGDARHTWGDVSKARHELAWEPRTVFEDGLGAQLQRPAVRAIARLV